MKLDNFYLTRMKYLLFTLFLFPVAAFAQCVNGIICDSSGRPVGVIMNGRASVSDTWIFSGDSKFSKSNLTFNADQYDGIYYVTINKSKTCTVVILEDSLEKIVLGCRKEFK